MGHNGDNSYINETVKKGLNKVDILYQFAIGSKTPPLKVDLFCPRPRTVNCY